MNPGRWNLRAGFTLLELAVSLALAAGIAAALLSALFYYEELGEKTAMELTIRNMRSGLRLEVARQIAAGRAPDFARLAAMNPVAWLDKPPDGYAGEIRPGAAATLERGKWYFDTGRGELIYVPRLAFHFRAAQGAAPRIHWRLRVRTTVAGRAGEAWIEIAAADYSWF